MQIAVSMEKPPGACFAGGGTNELELRRSLWLQAGSYYHRPKSLKPRPVRVSRFWANINEIQNRHKAGNTGMCLVGLSSGFEFLVVWGVSLGAKIRSYKEEREVKCLLMNAVTRTDGPVVLAKPPRGIRKCEFLRLKQR